ncbi:polymorphic toxin type 44 domain-containing protein [Mucispirillum schaedleri]|uniref:polymorphic toxin type 44 domain-containing protein n=1 Tax=Mucispirillum schaedleri TaxID=248039 RepID=UPI001F580885|nr:polymorphic toxin type 44 domain-containing protein [Mucispirillum schaedleri]
MFYEAVKTDSFWDHKWQLSALFPSMGLSRRYHHAYGDKEIPYDVWSNIHFGVLGKYCRFSENTLLGGADVAQRGSNFNLENIYTFKKPKGDTICDKAAIKLGFSIYSFYLANNYVKSDIILSDIFEDRVFIEYFKDRKCPDENNK